MIKKIALYIIILSFLPIPLYGQSGVYNSWSGLFWCEPKSCVHEVGHKLDDMSGWVSLQDDFKETVDDLGWTHGKNYHEKYANIFSFADGKKENMPVQLQKFYDWELSKLLLSNQWRTLQL